VLHADETPISLLDPGAGKTKKGYMWAYARGAYERERGVVFDSCLGRGGKYPAEFLKGWRGTLVVDAYAGYDALLSLEGRSAAYCFAHARRSSTNCSKPTRVRSPPRRSSASPGCTRSRPTPGR